MGRGPLAPDGAGECEPSPAAPPCPSQGVHIRTATRAELVSDDAPLRRALEALVSSWLDRHEWPPWGSAHAARGARGSRCRARGSSGGLSFCIAILARGGWLLQNLVRARDAPNGTAGLLVDHAMSSANDGATDGTSSMVTPGLAPLAGEVVPALRWARSAGAVLFDFEGLRAFKARLRRPGGRPSTSRSLAAKADSQRWWTFSRRSPTAGCYISGSGHSCGARRWSFNSWPRCSFHGRSSWRSSTRGTSRRPGFSGRGWRSTSGSPPACSALLPGGMTGSCRC